MPASRSTLSRFILPLLALSLGCFRPGWRVSTFQHADWKTGGLVFEGWMDCTTGRGIDCTEWAGTETDAASRAARVAAEKILAASCAQGWEVVLGAAPGLSVVTTPPTVPPTTLTSLPIPAAHGSMLLYRCKP